jgi:hypothetical protein
MGLNIYYCQSAFSHESWVQVAALGVLDTLDSGTQDTAGLADAVVAKLVSINKDTTGSRTF